MQVALSVRVEGDDDYSNADTAQPPTMVTTITRSAIPLIDTMDTATLPRMNVLHARY